MILMFKDSETIYYTLDGEYHREDGPAVIYDCGREEWYRHGMLDREDGPAVTNYEDEKYWYKNGMLHREDGPAIEEGDSMVYLSDEIYYLNNVNVSEEWYSKFLQIKPKYMKSVIIGKYRNSLVSMNTINGTNKIFDRYSEY
jgi:hypothetical protein